MSDVEYDLVQDLLLKRLKVIHEHDARSLHRAMGCPPRKGEIDLAACGLAPVAPVEKAPGESRGQTGRFTGQKNVGCVRPILDFAPVIALVGAFLWR